jgi:FeS assembly SUF system regulator
LAVRDKGVVKRRSIDSKVSNQYHFGLDFITSGQTKPMLRVSRLTDYATVVMTCIAAHPQDVLSTGQIADETRLELPTVSKLLKALGHATLVESFRGVNGGYRLARSAADISLAEIVEALEGPIGVTECSLAEGQCDRESQCGVRGSWQQVNSVLDNALRAVSLEDMLKTRVPAANSENVSVAGHAAAKQIPTRRIAATTAPADAIASKSGEVTTG